MIGRCRERGGIVERSREKGNVAARTRRALGRFGCGGLAGTPASVDLLFGVIPRGSAGHEREEGRGADEGEAHAPSRTHRRRQHRGIQHQRVHRGKSERVVIENRRHLHHLKRIRKKDQHAHAQSRVGDHQAVVDVLHLIPPQPLHGGDAGPDDVGPAAQDAVDARNLAGREHQEPAKQRQPPEDSPMLVGDQFRRHCRQLVAGDLAAQLLRELHGHQRRDRHAQHAADDPDRPLIAADDPQPATPARETGVRDPKHFTDVRQLNGVAPDRAGQRADERAHAPALVSTVG